MDPYNLKTASTYINNLLLARGLLRNGKPIEFAHPSRGEGGKEATMAGIINVVHDLILRRDRDEDQRESLVANIRALRAENTTAAAHISKLQARNEEVSRQLVTAQTQERNMRLSLRREEAAVRSLKEEMLRLKTTVAQVRTACANDVRKRDLQIQKLKTHLTSQQRGNKTGIVGASITIVPGVTGMGGPNYNANAGSSNGSAYGGQDGKINEREYALSRETTEFLTRLSQDLSDENDALIGLVRSTLVTLREIQGVTTVPGDIVEPAVDGEGLVVEHASNDINKPQDLIQSLPTSPDALASEMGTVLDHLRNLLSNPNFVSIDEVEYREQEIVRLRQGWETMELRWREALVLMDGWRRRLQGGGDTVNLDELKMGIDLGVGVETVNGDEDMSVLSVVDEEEDDFSADEEEEESEELEAEGLEEEEEEGDATEVMDQDEDAMESTPTASPQKTSSNTDLFNIRLEPPRPALCESNANIQRARRVSFHLSADQDAAKADESDELSPDHDSLLLCGGGGENSPTIASDLSKKKKKAATDDKSHDMQEKKRASRGGLAVDRDARSSPVKIRKRHSSPLPHPDERTPKHHQHQHHQLSVEQKLQTAQGQAEQAANKASLSSATATAATKKMTMQRRRRGTTSTTTSTTTGNDHDHDHAGEGEGEGESEGGVVEWDNMDAETNGGGGSAATATTTSAAERTEGTEEGEEVVAAAAVHSSPQRRRTRVPGRARRRKSTLTPDELVSLMGCE